MKITITLKIAKDLTAGTRSTSIPHKINTNDLSSDQVREQFLKIFKYIITEINEEGQPLELTSQDMRDFLDSEMKI